MFGALLIGLGIGAFVGGLTVLLWALIKPDSIKYPQRAKWMGAGASILGLLVILLVLRL